MKWENNNIKGMVEYINGELKKGRKLMDISISDFNVNYKSIVIRLEKEGYFMNLNEFIEAEKLRQQEEELKQEEFVMPNDSDRNLNAKMGGIPNEVDFVKLIELQNLIEPLKELLDKKVISSSDTELPQISYLNITRKTFKVDSEVLDKWLSFCKSKKGYKMQDLTSRALAEYMERHGW